ncbi:MAG: hypothetical protein MJ107_08810, partial [Lachnospiraceae bacterium]|nr:hypothetical protein [Lachnospiraceae bacterium]
MIKKIVKCVAFAVITLLVLNFIYGFLVIKDTNGGTDELLFSSVRQLENTPRNTVDVMFLGSSHCYNSIYPAVMWDEYGISAFDLAVTCQFKSVTYEMLKKSLRRQSPKVVCVEVFELDSGGPDEEEVGALYRNFLSVKSTPGLYNVLKEENLDNKSDFISRWPIVHTRYREFSQNDFVTSTWDKYGRGGEFRNGETGGYFSGYALCSDVVEISDSNREWVDKMVTLSKKEKFELVF